MIINFHPSLVIIESEKTNELLMGVYDQTYPLMVFRGSVNLMGGNPNPNDKGPLEVLLRELNEELASNHGEKDKFASKEDIKAIRLSITQKIVPFKDFFFKIKKIPGGRETHTTIGSVFYSNINQNAFEIARENLSRNKKIVSEGGLSIQTLDGLAKKGKFYAAHLTAPILNEYYGVKIPFPEEVHTRVLVEPKETFEDYLQDFSYNNGWREH